MVAENIELLEDEKRMINDILDLADMTVREIMKPRVDMIMAEDTEPARAALDRMRGTGYSRLPVYHEEVDEVIGLVSYKDLIGPLLDGRIEDPVAEFMYEPLYVPETKNVLKLLSELQEARMQMAIVVDEYGGTDGLITMEDIIEEIVGEIADRDPTTIATSLCLSNRTSGASTVAFPWRMPWNSAGRGRIRRLRDTCGLDHPRAGLRAPGGRRAAGRRLRLQGGEDAPLAHFHRAGEEVAIGKL